MNIFHNKYNHLTMDYKDEIKELFEDSSENNSEHHSDQANEKDSLLINEQEKIYEKQDSYEDKESSPDKDSSQDKDSSPDKDLNKKYSSKHEYKNHHHYLYPDDHHVKRNRLYIIQNFNPSIYFLNEHVNYAKSKNQKLLITNIGKYSITKPIQGKWMKSIMIDFFKQKKLNTKFSTIIDAFAGIGGDSIFFSKYFQHVHAIEKNKTHFEVLKNNIEVLDLSNVHLYMGNFMHIIQQAKLIDTKYILYMDPPWGGPEYKKQEMIDLEIELDVPNEKKLHEVMNSLYAYYQIVFLKAPINIQIEKDKFLYKNMMFKTDPENKILIIIFSKI